MNHFLPSWLKHAAFYILLFNMKIYETISEKKESSFPFIFMLSLCLCSDTHKL